MSSLIFIRIYLNRRRGGNQLKTQDKNISFLVLPFLTILVLGLVSCSGSEQKITLDPESRDFYTYAQLIMTKVEKNIFNHLPDKEARKEFMADFWVKRDPDPDTKENEFKDEFYRRIEYANKRFREGTPGWKTDRGRIYIYLGPPDKFEETFTHSGIDSRGEIVKGPKLILSVRSRDRVFRLSRRREIHLRPHDWRIRKPQ
jgi:GWxTD domain-containing protein